MPRQYTPALMQSILDRLLPNGECRVWTGARSSAGYGQIRVDNRLQYVHRLVARYIGGPLNPGEVVRHSCDNPPCARPEHLLRGSQAENLGDMARRGRAATGARHGMHTHPERRPGRLSVAQIVEIRARYAAGETNGAALARAYGIGKSQVGRIIKRQCWELL